MQDEAIKKTIKSKINETENSSINESDEEEEIMI